MKKIILLGIAVIALFGCSKNNTPKRDLKEVLGIENIQVIEIDSCEYIFVPSGNASWGAHKGNCKFCLKRNQKSLTPCQH